MFGLGGCSGALASSGLYGPAAVVCTGGTTALGVSTARKEGATSSSSSSALSGRALPTCTTASSVRLSVSLRYSRSIIHVPGTCIIEII